MKHLETHEINRSTLSEANELFRLGEYQNALKAYIQISKDPRLKSIAKFNIELIQKRTGITLHIDDSGLSLNERNVLELAGSITPLVSIVIPAYNAKDFIEKTIHQIEKCTHYPIEIIVVDDGSNDGTLDILLKLKSRYANLTCISQKNSGAGIARNTAIDACKGVYTYFFDADDTIDVSELCQAALDGQKKGTELIFLPYDILYVKKNKREPMFPSDMHLYRAHSSFDTSASIKSNALKLIGYPWNRLILTTTLKSHEIKFGTTSVHNDIRFHWHSICVSKSLDFWHKTVCTHNKFDGGTLSSDKGRRRFSAFSAIDETFETLKNNEFFIDNQKTWANTVQEMLTWNLKIINSDLKDEFSALSDKFQKEMITKIASLSNAVPPPKKNSKSIISIITITRNIFGTDDEKKNNLSHFEDMIKSVNKQTYGRSFIEHVVIDGDSTDGTKEMLKALKESNLIDIFISEPDSGIYNAMNKGVANASGDFILFLNAHDKLSESALASLVTAIEKTEADYAFGDSLTVDEKDKPVGQHIGNINRIFFGMPYCHQAALFKRNTFKTVKFPENFRITTWKYALNLYLHGFKHVYMPGVMAYFRVGGVSTSESSRQKFLGELKSIKMEIAEKLLSVPYETYEEIRNAALTNTGFNTDLINKIEQIKNIKGNKHENFCSHLTHYMKK